LRQAKAPAPRADGFTKEVEFAPESAPGAAEEFAEDFARFFRLQAGCEMGAFGCDSVHYRSGCVAQQLLC
jgi:hypothetical protein